VRRLEIARLFGFVREAAGNANSGAWVEAIQRTTGNGKGDAWCASFVYVVLALAYGGTSPLPRSASCQVLYDHARKHDMLTDTPLPGDVYLLLDATGRAHHVGFVTRPLGATFEELSGNTNPDGGREGYGVFERTGERARKRSARTVFIRLPNEPSQ
jgi:hypothetical protein